jgi:hypothetical protein
MFFCAVIRIAVIIGDSSLNCAAIFLLDGFYCVVNYGINFLPVGLDKHISAEGSDGQKDRYNQLPPAAFFRTKAAEGKYSEKDKNCRTHQCPRLPENVEHFLASFEL